MTEVVHQHIKVKTMGRYEWFCATCLKTMCEFCDEGFDSQIALRAHKSQVHAY